MTTRLRIGEVAGLLGVTTKTIRHYHKVGVLPEPPRSAGGYRLYTADDLLRLHRARQLQALGLSLAQIARLLGEDAVGAGGHSLRAVLEALHADLAARIAQLTERRERVERLLADAAPDLDAPAQPSPTLELIRANLGERLPELGASLWEQEARIWSLLDAFAWPAEQEEQRRGYVAELARHLAASPERFERWRALAERLVALADLPEDAPEVARLAEEFARQQERDPLPPDLADGGLAPGEPWSSAMGDLLLSTLSPAQRRFVALVQRADRRGPDGGRRADADGGAR